jgi:hypothetical protein
MRGRTFFHKPLLAVVAFLFIAGCTDNDIAIFYFIENEVKQVDYSLPNESTILGMGKVTAGTTDYYFASAGPSVWRKNAGVSDADWNDVSVPNGFATALVDFGGDLYAGSTNGLYTASAARSPSWTKVNDSLLNGKQLMALFQFAEPRIFAATFDGSSYSLYSSPSGVGGTFAAEITGASKPIAQVAYDGTTNYYVVTGTSLYEGTSGALATQPSPSLGSGEELTGVVFANSKLYVATDEGSVFATTPPAFTWPESTEESVSGELVWFERMASVDTGPSNVMVGTHLDGFFDTKTGNVSDLARIPDFTADELYNGWVRDFYVDGSTVFALTAGSGLWRATYAGTEFSDWIHE